MSKFLFHGIIRDEIIITAFPEEKLFSRLFLKRDFFLIIFHDEIFCVAIENEIVFVISGEMIYYTYLNNYNTVPFIFNV